MAKVLIIDDDELICEMLSLMVEDMGHSPSYRLTIEEGFKAASSEPFDVVFLDIRMPGASGFEVLQWIRRNPALDAMPVIMLSSSEDRRDVTRAAQLGAQCYLAKHPTASCLRETIKHAALFAGGLNPGNIALFRIQGNLLRSDRLSGSEPVAS